jgi:hypothetical protein
VATNRCDGLHRSPVPEDEGQAGLQKCTLATSLQIKQQKNSPWKLNVPRGFYMA